jgi:3'-phosphoadenosine 5'-phosphosulfate sulfotransferase (PAPS reductase)/FAD synthetase
MGVKILVPVSGGKDSQASLKLALEHYEPHEIRGLFCDTNFEHHITYKHVNETLRDLYGVRIDTVSGGDVLGKSVKYGRFPGGGARHCTDELKIRETRIYCHALAYEQGSRVANKRKGIEASSAGGFEVWYGMRSKESPERAKRYAGKVCDELYPPHEVIRSKYPKYLEKLGVMFRLCVLDWTDQDVIDYVGWDNLNPLYHAKFPRVGCFPCLASGDKWKAKAFTHDDFGRSQHQRVIKIESQIGKSVWTSKKGAGCMICEI